MPWPLRPAGCEHLDGQQGWCSSALPLPLWLLDRLPGASLLLPPRAHVLAEPLPFFPSNPPSCGPIRVSCDHFLPKLPVLESQSLLQGKPRQRQ